MAATCARVKGEKEKHTALKAKFKVRIAKPTSNSYVLTKSWALLLHRCMAHLPAIACLKKFRVLEGLTELDTDSR